MSDAKHDHDPGDTQQRDAKEWVRAFILRLIGTEDDTWRSIRTRLEQAAATEDRRDETSQPPLEIMSGAARAARDIAEIIRQQLLPAMLLPQNGVGDDELQGRGCLVEPERLQTDRDRVVILPGGWNCGPTGEHTNEMAIYNADGEAVFSVFRGPGGGVVRRLLPPLELSRDNP